MSPKRMMRRPLRGSLLLLLIVLAACARPPVVQPPEKHSPLEAVPWSEIEGWRQDEPADALKAFLRSCGPLHFRPEWRQVCAEASDLPMDEPGAVFEFFETRFTPFRVANPDGSDTGTITGYYVPELNGSRERSEGFPYPLYAPPDDLLVIDLDELYPELGKYRLRGRLEGRRVVPYWSRSEIDGNDLPLKGNELFWVEDPVELFFLQIQGSGLISLPDGEKVMVSYADQNGFPYRSIGKCLLDRGEMTRAQMSMQNIRAWARKNPKEVEGLLCENPSYVFFREVPDADDGPPGALGVSLTSERSLAVDPRVIPLGAPVFLSTTWPNSSAPLRRLMIAQDTGGAIKGAVRADFFWGEGNEAGELAGRMKQQGRMWVLLPAGHKMAAN